MAVENPLSPSKAFGSRLKEARKSLKKTQQEFADMADVAVTTWGAYESGEIEPGIHKLSFLVGYGISVDWLLFGDEYLTTEQKLIRTQEQVIWLANEKIESLGNRRHY